MIMPLHAFDDDGKSDLFTLAKAMCYAVDHGAQIINLNFDIDYRSLAVESAVQFAQNRNVLLVAPAGNIHTSQPQYPAALNGVISVAATDLSDIRASFSNYGSYVFAAAPGVGIISAYPGNYYGIASGTSLSAAAVAGTAALAILSNSSATFTINGLNAGDHTLTASYAAQDAFAASSATGTLHINPRPITAKADPKSKTYGTVDPILTYQITSGSLVNGDNFTGSLTRASGQDAGFVAANFFATSSPWDFAWTFLSTSRMRPSLPI